MRRSKILGATLLAVIAAAGGTARAVTVEAAASAPAEVGRAVTFSAHAEGSGAITYSWNFGDGTITDPSADASASHVYAAPGHYAVIVIARDQTGARSASFLQTIHRPVTSPRATASSTIVHDPSRHRVCNVNADNDSVSCIDTETLKRLFEAPVGAHPRTLAIGPDGSIWVSNQDAGTLSVLRADGALDTTIELGKGAAPFGVAMSPAGDSVFVSLQGSGEVVAFDTKSRAERARRRAGNFPAGLAISTDGARVLVTSFISPQDHAEVSELDGVTLSPVRVHQLALDPGPDGEGGSRGVPNYLRSVVISPDGASALVPSKKDNVLRGGARDGLPLNFETSVRTIVSQLDFGSGLELLDQRLDFNNRALGLAATFSPLGDYFFLAMLGSGGVSMVDAYNGNTVGGIQKLTIAPDGVVLDATGRLYVHSFLSRKVIVLDAAAALGGTAFELPVLTEIATVDVEKLATDVLEGKKIFYDASDPRMTQHGYLSCAGCHLDGFEDARVWDFTDRGEGLRNTTSLLGKRGTGQGRLHWSANFDEVQDFEHDIRNAFNGTGFMSEADFATGTRNTTLGDRKAGVSPELDALSAYVTSLDRAPPSPFRDRDGSLTAEGWKGREVFKRAGCPECHGGADFTDSSSGALHDVGTLRPTSGKRLNAALEGIDTPTLRGVWATAPYLHDGSAATLHEVIRERNPDDRHGRTSALGESERAALVSYLLQIDNTALESEREEAPQAQGPGAAEEAGGCGCRTPRSPSGSGAALLALLLGLALVRRRG
jgi:MYXO-CTERM domain-containing protein